MTQTHFLTKTAILLSTAILSWTVGHGQTAKLTIKQNFWVSDTVLDSKEYKNDLIQSNFASLWTATDNSYTYGIIGDNFQRLKIKIITAKKDTLHPDIYFVYGKSMVKNNICQFNGTIKITSIRIFKNSHWGVDDEFKDKGIKKQGILICDYNFLEDSTQSHVGQFRGTLTTLWYQDKDGKIKYDDIEKVSDNYRNNQFTGTWQAYKSADKKVCNWGDYRIPFSKDLDIGAGEFSPADKYLQYGWQNLRNAWNNDEKAKKDEYRVWWK